MKKFNGPKLDEIILAGHLQMMNFEAIEKYRKPHWLYDNLGIILAIGLMVYVAIRQEDTMSRIPMNESAASWEIKQKANESAIPHVVLYNGRSTYRAQTYVDNSYASYCDSIETKLYREAIFTDKGRKPGSRIIEDPTTGEFYLS